MAKKKDKRREKKGAAAPARPRAAYEAARPSIYRKGERERGSGNAAVLRAGTSLREQARHLEQNLDLARGVLDVLVRNTVGTGIGVEPQPRDRKGDVHRDVLWQLTRLWREWTRRPEVTWRHSWGAVERLAARTWFRDGEVFGQLIEGNSATGAHGTAIPFSVEMLEADLVPIDLHETAGDHAPAVMQGIEVNGWLRPTGYRVYKQHPGEVIFLGNPGQTKRIPAERMLHLAHTDRINQLRGVSVFASVIGRFEDLKDLEESERVAAKVAASMAAYIKKGEPGEYQAPSESEYREMRFRSGMIFDDLRPGEDIGTIDTKRPNPNVATWRHEQLRALSAGVGTSFSSAAKNYDGTYSAQRQELVEQDGAYRILQAEFIERWTRRTYEDFVEQVVAANLLLLPRSLDMDTLKDAIYIGPQMPWIDPWKEVQAWALLEDRTYASGPEIIRRRGASPYDVLDQQRRWQDDKAESGVPPAPATDPGAPPDDDDKPGARTRQRKRSYA